MSSTTIGRDVQRRLTDWGGFLLYGVTAGLFMILVGHAFHFGNPDRIIYGTDYNGNVCGEGSAASLNLSIAASDWSSRKLLWYPITFSPTTGKFELTSALNFGVCVAQCPVAVLSSVATYGGSSASVPSSYRVLFASQVTMHRCLPVFSTYNCQSDPNCEKTKDSQQSNLLNELGVGDLFYGAVTQVQRMWGMSVTMSLVSILLCYGWLFSLRRLVKPLMVITAVGFLMCLVVIGAVAAHERSTVAAGSAEDWYTAVAVIAFAAAFFYACALLYFYKDLLLSCSIIELSSRVVVDVPYIAIVPVVSSLVVFLCGLFAFYIAVMIYSSSTIEHEQQVAPQSATNSSSATAVVVPENWRTFGQLFNIFMFLWTMGFVHAVAYMVVALVGVQWYWSTPGEAKVLPSDPVRWSLTTTLRYHLGTLLIGSFLIAVVQLARILLRMLENRLKKIAGGESDPVKCLLCCANCLLACFERIVKFLTKNAYIMTAMSGDSLLDGARNATSLLIRNANVLFVDIIGEVVMTVGKALITCFVVLLGYAWMRGLANSSSSAGGDEETTRSNFVVVLAFLALLVYFIASVFASVFSVCIDTVLLCYCVDKSENNGLDRPHYFPPELEQHINASAQRRHESGGAEKDALLPSAAKTTGGTGLEI